MVARGGTDAASLSRLRRAGCRRTLPLGHRNRKAGRTDIKELPIERFPNAHAMNRVAGRTDTFGYLVEALIAGFEATRKGRKRRKALSD